MMAWMDVRRARGLAAGALAMAAAAWLVGCGGGTAQVEPFKPGRVIVFGDENSVLVNDGANNGRKYSVNGLDANAARDCTVLPLWVQTLADYYGFVFAECNKNNGTPRAFIRAKVGAKVDDPTLGMAQQIAEQIAAGDGFKSNDLVTILIGGNDIIELNDRVQAGGLSASDAVAEAKRRGTHLAERINAILGAGAKAIVVTIPDMGLSPYAVELNKTSPGTTARVSSMSFEFNAALRTMIDQTRFDGRNYGLVLADDTVQTIARFASAYGYSNVVSPLCVVALPNCTTASADLVSGGTTDSYMWADDRRFSPSIHSRIGSQALTRALNNPL